MDRSRCRRPAFGDCGLLQAPCRIGAVDRAPSWPRAAVPFARGSASGAGDSPRTDPPGTASQELPLPIPGKRANARRSRVAALRVDRRHRGLRPAQRRITAAVGPRRPRVGWWSGAAHGSRRHAHDLPRQSRQGRSLGLGRDRRKAGRVRPCKRACPRPCLSPGLVLGGLPRPESPDRVRARNRPAAGGSLEVPGSRPGSGNDSSPLVFRRRQGADSGHERGLGRALPLSCRPEAVARGKGQGPSPLGEHRIARPRSACR